MLSILSCCKQSPTTDVHNPIAKSAVAQNWAFVLAQRLEASFLQAELKFPAYLQSLLKSIDLKYIQNPKAKTRAAEFQSDFISRLKKSEQAQQSPTD